jgi:hypothetical protein
MQALPIRETGFPPRTTILLDRHAKRMYYPDLQEWKIQAMAEERALISSIAFSHLFISNERRLQYWP